MNKERLLAIKGQHQAVHGAPVDPRYGAEDLDKTPLDLIFDRDLREVTNEVYAICRGLTDASHRICR